MQFGGVIGAFNCQGAGWDPKEQRIKGYSECYKPMSGTVHVSDVEWDQTPGSQPLGSAEEYAVYLDQAEELLVTTPKSNPIQITIQPSTFELFSFVPIKKLGRSAIKFAPIGLTNMFNSGGTVQELNYGNTTASIKVKGGGNFLVYASLPPKSCSVNDVDVAFGWSVNGKLTVDVPWVEEAGGISTVDFFF